MKTIVFVCTGNTCRSPMAEGLFRVLMHARGRDDVQAGSCGLCTFTGMPATDLAVQAAAEYGVDISAHRSRRLSEYILSQSDLLVCMTADHAAALRRYVPREKIRILAGGVPDPFGGTPEDYRKCAAQIYKGLEDFIQEDLK